MSDILLYISLRGVSLQCASSSSPSVLRIPANRRRSSDVSSQKNISRRCHLGCETFVRVHYIYDARKKWALAKRDGDWAPSLGSVGSRYVKRNILLAPFQRSGVPRSELFQGGGNYAAEFEAVTGLEGAIVLQKLEQLEQVLRYHLPKPYTYDA